MQSDSQGQQTVCSTHPIRTFLLFGTPGLAYHSNKCSLIKYK